MYHRHLYVYVVFMWLLAAACLLLTDWQYIANLPTSGLIGLGALVAIALLAESVAIGLDVGDAGGQSSITFLPLLAAVQLFGPPAGVLTVVVTIAFVEFLVRRKPPFKALFNVSQAVLAATVAGHAFSVLGGQPLRGSSGAELVNLGPQLAPFTAFGILFLTLNHASVALAIAFSQALPFRRVWTLIVRNSGASLSDILVSPIALAVAFLYVHMGLAGILVVLLPMLFIRYSYLTTAKLRAANADLLTALIKAIETRDPYTSGHSLRVSQLARRIADHIGLSAATSEHVQTAALLHDIGKIDPIFTSILSKRDSLTAEERAIIQSHVERGVALLRDLSSVPGDVILAVRHHHEREDGEGYPDRIPGSAIPIGAKIISICDAVDAMLSDRPYRRALPLSVVLDQLRQHAGIQFDAAIVAAVLDSDILVDYARMMRGKQPVREAPWSRMASRSPSPRPPKVHEPHIA